jgi:acetyl-CoA synthetase
MLPEEDTYDRLVSAFRWKIPERYNIGVDVCDRWAEATPDHPALIVAADARTQRRVVSFAELRALSNRMANLFAASGVGRGDRVGVLLPQAVETAAAHIAAFKLGAISIPLFTLFGPDALQYRLADSGAKLVITHRDGAEKIAEIRQTLPELVSVFSIDGATGGADCLADALAAQPETFAPVQTAADDPALIIYTSGTTGPPKGALHAHRVLLGHIPGVQMAFDLLPQAGDVLWTPADWAWIGGLLDVLMPGLHFGLPVVTRRFEKFSGEDAFALMAAEGVTAAFIPPTALKMMRRVEAPAERWPHKVRTIASGGETLGAELLNWGRETFGVTINEFYGQTECNMIVSSCNAVMPARPGKMGRTVPGHALAVIDQAGREVPFGEEGMVAVRKPDPVMFLEYWNAPDATAGKFVGEWMVTGDRARCDGDGWLQFVGRDDDVITSSGYRIGPGEIEDTLITHPAIAMAGVVGKPDPERTEIVKAFVVLADGHAPSDALASEIQDYVKQRLAAHEYPREIAFVEALPLTTTGKIIRRELRALG